MLCRVQDGHRCASKRIVNEERKPSVISNWSHATVGIDRKESNTNTLGEVSAAPLYHFDRLPYGLCWL